MFNTHDAICAINLLESSILWVLWPYSHLEQHFLEQDKYLQKVHFSEHGIPLPKFMKVIQISR